MSYKLKTTKSDTSVKKYIDSLENDQKKEDCLRLLEVFTEVSGYEAEMWGESIIGFGTYSYTNTSKKEHQFFRTGFAPRASGISLYIMPGYQFENMQEHMNTLGKYKAGKACINIKKLSDIHIESLKNIIRLGLKEMSEKYPE